MSYIYPDVDTLPGLPAIGNQQCAPLVEHYAKAPAPAALKWQEGVVVKGNLTLTKGTAIATFVNGRYPSLPSGNHAALYVSQDATGVWVVDQYFGSNGIHKRLLHFKGKLPGGGYVDPSNNGDAFPVIE
ncbi:MAG: hypothetical protein QOD93_2294 [Acetobacteraceae bacterium]|jgi:hypothetical protein|nr:hypothetical protein [Rhodopila sp.]MEA2732784.1 hypothetical protein [Acetobacteraceae bacterium]MEA2769332.1 hypothetical protein [Acetobacteraceae bacterium]